jgi:hypothetical protein
MSLLTEVKGMLMCHIVFALILMPVMLFPVYHTPNGDMLGILCKKNIFSEISCRLYQHHLDNCGVASIYLQSLDSSEWIVFLFLQWRKFAMWIANVMGMLVAVSVMHIIHLYDTLSETSNITLY